MKKNGMYQYNEESSIYFNPSKTKPHFNSRDEEMPLTGKMRSVEFGFGFGFDQNQTVISVEGASMDDLPPKVLTQILQFLDVPSLLACRLIKQRWLEISSGILRTRPEVNIQFNADVETGMLMMDKRGSLHNFLNLMKKSKSCPFSRFFFSIPSQSFWSQFLYFLAEFGVTRITGLNLSFLGYLNIKELCEKLEDLLLKIIPHLTEFGLEMPPILNPNDSQSPIKLFPTAPNSTSTSVVGCAQLPHLKVLHLRSSMFSEYPGITQQLLTAAVNLEKIQPFPSTCFQFRVLDFQYLQSIGKLGCLKELVIVLSDTFISEISRQIPNLPHLLKLSTLYLFSPNDSHDQPVFPSNTAKFLSTLFESSQNTLTTLRLEPLGFLNNLRFPRFTKLQHLSLDHYFEKGQDVQESRIFPPGVKFQHVFPVVRFLDLQTNNLKLAFPEENSTSRFPSVERVQFSTDTILCKQIEQLASICPKLKHLKIIPNFVENSSLHINFLEVGRVISAQMRKLESLELYVDLDFKENDSLAFDSCFTGFSEKECNRLYRMEKGGERGVRNGSMPKREFPSIFDMKNLKELTVNPHAGGIFVKRKHFTQKLSWISKKYTLELMPNLKLTKDEGEDGDNENEGKDEDEYDSEKKLVIELEYALEERRCSNYFWRMGICFAIVVFKVFLIIIIRLFS